MTSSPVQILYIAVGAVLGALLRFSFGLKFNDVFPPIPLGVLLANLLGCFLMGFIMLLFYHKTSIDHQILVGITIGFLGSLTTFSSFTGDVIYLLITHQAWLATLAIGLHVGGSILMTYFGYLTGNFFFK